MLFKVIKDVIPVLLVGGVSGVFSILLYIIYTKFKEKDKRQK